MFPRVIDEPFLVCESCGHRDSYRVPRAFDWRDHEAVALFKGCCSALSCSACDEPVPVATPVVVSRPGDPIRWLVSVQADTPTDAQSEAERALLETAWKHTDGATAGPTVRLRHAQAVEIVDRYSGFLLSSLSHEGRPVRPENANAWLQSARSQIVVPDLVDSLCTLREVTDSKEVPDVLGRHPALLDRAWAPVLGALRHRVLAVLDTPEAQRTARYRLEELDRRRWPHDPVPADAMDRLHPADRERLTRIRDSVAVSADERRVLLADLLRLVEELPAHRALLTEDLTVFFVKTYESPHRSAVDLEVSIAAGRAAVPLAEAVFGPDHPMTLMALNDYGAALLDQQQGDVHSAREEAVQSLGKAARAAITAEDRILGDILQNLGAAYAHRQQDGRVGNQERAEKLFAWAVHVTGILTPERPRNRLVARLAWGSVLRERRSGDRRVATAQALAVFEDVLRDGEQRGLLSLSEQVRLRSNRVSARHQLRLLDPGTCTLDQIAEEAEAVAVAAEQLGTGDVARFESLSNVASVIGDLYLEDGFNESSRLASAVDLTGKAYAEAQSCLGRDHPETLRTGLNHAAMLGMPVTGEEDAGKPGAVVKPFDGDRSRRLLTELLAACPARRLPAHTAVIANNLGRAHCATGQWAAACEAFRTAMTAVDLLYRQASHPEAQLAELGSPVEQLSWSSLAGWLVSASLQAGDPAGVVAVIEESRGKLLRDKFRVTVAGAEAKDGASHGALLYVGTSALSSWVVLVPPAGEARYFVTPLAAGDLRPAVLALRRATDAVERSAALAALADLLLGTLTGPVHDLLAAYAITDVGVIASGLLSGLPLHTLRASATGDCWLDLATVRYLPSAAIARHIEALPSAAAEQAVAVTVPELPLGRHEVQLLGQAMGSVLRAPDSGDRRHWLFGVLPGASHLLLSCHALSLDGDPLRSWIGLSSRQKLLLEDLLKLDGLALDLVVASCCETGVASEVLADELVGFGTAMLLAGAKAAVVTNWPITARVSALLLSVFYEEIANGTEAATALRTAQLWLARLTVQDLVELGRGRPAQGRHPNLPRGLALELAALRFTDLMKDSLARPYADPETWGGFAHYGVRVERHREDGETGSGPA